jgi:hypothetical protein
MRYAVRTILILLAAPSAVWAQPPTIVPLNENGPSLASGGQIFVDGRIDSVLLHESRSVHLVLPVSFRHSAADRRYPVIVVLDGEESTPPAAAVVGELSRNEQIPEMILVTIPNTNRLRDLTPPGLSVSGSTVHEGGDAFLDFIERELLPAVDKQYRGDTPRVLVGHSSGGILATYAAATRPAFRVVVAIDTPTQLGEGWLVAQLSAREQSMPGTLRYASYESRFGFSDASWTALIASAPDTWRLHRERLLEETHESIPMLAMYLALRGLFDDYAARNAPDEDPSLVMPYYARVSSALASRMVPPRGVLARLVRAFIARGNAADARTAYQALARGYGVPADAPAIESQLSALSSGHRPAETVDTLLATPFPSLEEAKPFLGEWVGSIWMNPDEPRQTVRLRVRVENGRVVGETVRRMTDGVENVQRWQYMRITAAGLTFGRLNGMEPRGVALFEGTLRGDTLAGAMRIAGIAFTDADAPPPLYFEFKHVR